MEARTRKKTAPGPAPTPKAEETTFSGIIVPDSAPPPEQPAATTQKRDGETTATPQADGTVSHHFRLQHKGQFLEFEVKGASKIRFVKTSAKAFTVTVSEPDVPLIVTPPPLLVPR